MSEYYDLSDAELGEFHALPSDVELDWTDPALKEIVCICYLTDPCIPFWYLAFAYGYNQLGERVHVKGLPDPLIRYFGLSDTEPLVDQLLVAARKVGVLLKGLCGGEVTRVLWFMEWEGMER